MNLKKHKYSIASCVVALASFCSTVLAIEGSKVNDDISGVFWPYLAPVFSAFSGGAEEPGFKNVPAFPITDTNIILVLFLFGIGMAICAIVVGYVARKRGEYSLIYAGPVVFSIMLILASLPYFNVIVLL